jgi:hypothetical protein
MRRSLGAGVAFLLADIAFGAVTRRSLVAPEDDVGPFGFAVRAALFLITAAVRFGHSAEPRLRFERGALVLLAAALVSLFQFQFAGRRISGDGLMYYVFLRSLAIDADVDLANEYAHYGIADRADLGTPTETGYRRSIFSIGPAVFLLPFFGASHVLALAAGPALGMTDLSGYGPWHVNGSAFGSWTYGIAAVFLIRRALRRSFGDFVSTLTSLATLGATFLPWYLAVQPLMSHAISAFAATLVLLLWRRFDADPGAGRAASLGLVIGLAMCVRWQNGLLLLLPATTVIRGLRPRSGRTVAHGLSVLAAALVGASPQLIAWKAIFGSYVLEAPPHGSDFVRLDHPYVLNTLFSSRHGLLSWTPVFWFSLVGLTLRLLRRETHAPAFAFVFAAMTYVNMCSGDWWAGGSFSNRRFDSVLVFLAFGIATAFDFLLARFRNLGVPWRGTATALLVAAVVGFVADSGNASPSAVRGFVSVFGFPTTWPASWIFAVRHGVSPNRYDRAAGRYLFYRQNNLGGRIDLGRDDRDDESLILDGFSEPVRDGRFTARTIRGPARVLAPLDTPEDIVVGVRARQVQASGAGGGVTATRVAVNGTEIGAIDVGTDWDTQDLFAPRSLWRREMNEIELRADESTLIDVLIFKRGAPTQGAPSAGISTARSVAPAGLWQIAAPIAMAVGFGLVLGLRVVRRRVFGDNTDRPAAGKAALILITLGLTLWNVFLMENLRRGRIPTDDTVDFAGLLVPRR